jgi:hypothetical protein
VIWNGKKLMHLVVNQNLEFKDSLLHIQAALHEFPKIFGLDETRFAKGFFPYKFNTRENQDYVGAIPVMSMFEPQMMSSQKRKEFLEWYEEQKNVEYNFKEELTKYCISDVDILAKSLEVYISEGMNMNSGLNPMECVTIASYAMKVYRSIHMPPNLLGVLKQEEIDFAKEAFHGGRTDVRTMLKFYNEKDLEEGIYAKYQDVQSLYPTVQFFKPLPVGIPRIHKFTIAPSLDEIKNWFGLVKCDIEPAKYIHHPVLLKKEDKLIATLEPLKGVVITTPELLTALENGYNLVRVYEYHEYDQSTELFKSYIRTYLKIKIECNGMPKHIKSENDWNVFHKYHLDVLGIDLEKDKMVKNSGKKQLAKLMLNSLWGKFAENRVYQKHVKVVGDQFYSQMENLVLTNEIELQSEKQVSPGNFMMVIKPLNTKYDRNRAMRTNLTLASFVTSWGALILWGEMNKLGDRVLYHDTDSIIYEHNPNLYNIPEGKYLGEWEDETGGAPIVKFVSIGPKTYSYAYLGSEESLTDENLDRHTESSNDIWINEKKKTIKPLVYKSKCKGFTLNAYNSMQINFNSMQQLLLGTRDRLQSTNLQFSWSMYNGIRSYYENKYMAFTYDKGVIDKRDFKVYPYGYERFIEIGEIHNQNLVKQRRRY